MKQLILLIIIIVTSIPTYAQYQFPLEDKYTEKVNGMTVLSSWYYMKREDVKGCYKALNIPTILNAPVRAIDSGRVVETGYNRISGIYIKTALESGLIISYEHLNNWLVRKGDMLNKGDILGLAGRTGRTTGVNLRLVALEGNKRVYISDRFGVKFWCEGDGKVKGVTIE